MTGESRTYYGAFNNNNDYDEDDYNALEDANDRWIGKLEFLDFIKDYDTTPKYKPSLNLDSVLIFKIIPRARNNC